MKKLWLAKPLKTKLWFILLAASFGLMAGCMLHYAGQFLPGGLAWATGMVASVVFGVVAGPLFFLVALWLSGRRARMSAKARSAVNIIIFILALLLVPFIMNGLANAFQYKSMFNTIAVYFDGFHTAVLLRSWLWLVLVYLLLITVSGGGLATLLLGAGTILLGIIDSYKSALRGDPLYPWDIDTVETFLFIGGDAGVRLSAQVVTLLAFWLFMTVLCGAVRLPWRWFGAAKGGAAPSRVKKPRLLRGISLLVCAGLVCGYYYLFFYGPLSLEQSRWDPKVNYYDQGFVTAFMTATKSLNAEQPEGYSQDAVEQAAAGAAATGGTAPNIILVMNETFFDIEQRWPELEFDRELYPNLRRLQSQAVHGEVLCHTLGGGTETTEFESLTGFSNNYLTAGMVAFTRIANKPVFSLAAWLREAGYGTVGMHPAPADNWNRATAYENLGFEETLFIDDFEGLPLVRGERYHSDAAVYTKVIEEFEAHNAVSDAPQFQFVVTIQNHMKYDETLWPEEEWVGFDDSGMHEKVASQMRDLATSLHASDAALGELLAYFEGVEEPTIVVMYGDHQTALDEAGSDPTKNPNTYNTTPEDVWHNYRTPFVAWANYTAQSENLGVLDPGMMMPRVMEAYGVAMPGWYDLLCDYSRVLPGYYHGLAAGPSSTWSAQMDEGQQAVFNEYQMMQYDYLFGKRYGLELFEPYYTGAE